MARKFAVGNGWASAGRSGETANCKWKTLSWDYEFNAVFCEVLQSKVHQMKLIAFCAGHVRGLCFFKNLGDYLSTRTLPVHEPDVTDWLVPELQQTGSPGTTLGSYIKAMQPDGHKSYGAHPSGKFAVPELPEKATAGGLRVGASCTLAKYMRAEVSCHVTGHDHAKVVTLMGYC